MITRHQGEFPVRLLCRVLEVSVAGFYADLKRPECWRAVIDDVLMAHSRIAFVASGETYSAPRVFQELQEAGLPTSIKRVARLMRTEGLVARPRKRGRAMTTDSNHADPIALIRLARQFDVHGVAIHQVGVGDITYVPSREGFLSVATVLDLGSRRCVGWAMRHTMEVELVTSALRMARGLAPGAGLDFPFGPQKSLCRRGLPHRAHDAWHAREHERPARLL